MTVEPGGPAQPCEFFEEICAARRSDSREVALDTEEADALLGDFSDGEQVQPFQEPKEVRVESASGSAGCAHYKLERHNASDVCNDLKPDSQDAFNS